MGKKILAAIDAARVRDAERRADWARTDAWKRVREGVLGVLEDAADRAASSFESDCVELLKSKISGKVTRADFEMHCNLLDEAARREGRGCARCDNSGIVISDGVRRCSCLAGQRINERAYGAPRTDGAREIVIIPSIK